MIPKAEHNLSAEWPMVSPVENSATAGNCNKNVNVHNILFPKFPGTHYFTVKLKIQIIKVVLL